MNHEKCSKIFTTIITIFVFFILPLILQGFAASDQIQANLNVICDGNGVCEGAYGEDKTNCPADCACNNNGICEGASGENITNCPADCACNNNGICEPAAGENSNNCLLDCPPRGMGYAVDATPPIIYNLLISEITLNSAGISWDTNEEALCQLFWGQTPEYETEVISEGTFSLNHSTELKNLSSGNTYHFKIKCRDSFGNETETKDQRFITLAPPDITPPANISNFEAIASDGQIELKWQNPSDVDFKAVRIMRSTEFYPSDPWTDTPVFNDKGTSFVDTGLTNGMRYYYTAFTYDLAGNYSSGAIVSSVPHKPGVIPPPEVIPPVVPPPPEIEKITFNEFDFIQEKEKIPLEEGIKIKTKTKEPLTISIDYEKVPEVLKTIMVTLEKDKKFFSFLLRVNKEKTAYLSMIMPPEEAGIYPLTLTILDYKNQTLKKITGQLIVEKTEIQPPPIPWCKKYQSYILLAAIMILAAIIYLYKKLKAKRRNEKLR